MHFCDCEAKLKCYADYFHLSWKQDKKQGYFVQGEVMNIQGKDNQALLECSDDGKYGDFQY